MHAWVVMLLIAQVPGELPGELPGDFQRGVNHAHVHRGDRGYGSVISANELKALRDIGVTHVALTPFGYQRSFDDDRVRYGGDRSMSDAHLVKEIASAHAAGLQVVMKPHIWSRDFWQGAQWHGTVAQGSPEAHARWWSDYCEMILHLAALCAAHEVEIFCLGTELVKMTGAHPDEWRALIADVRDVYAGELTYAAHWHEEVDAVAFWDALDFVGVAAYFPLDAPAGATEAQLVKAWQPHAARLARLAARTGKRVVFMEVGYRPVSDTHVEPWRYDGGERDEAAQARAYGAMFRALGDERWWGGAYLWKTFTDPGRRREGFVFRGLEAEGVVKDWFGGEAR